MNCPRALSQKQPSLSSICDAVVFKGTQHVACQRQHWAVCGDDQCGCVEMLALTASLHSHGKSLLSEEDPASSLTGLLMAGSEKEK